MKDENEILVSIIIINYDSLSYLKDCLNSISEKVKNLNYEVIIIDNKSKKDKNTDLEEVIFKIKDKIANLTIIKNSENLGFAKANNQGIQIAKGKFIFLLNPDTLILNNKLKELIDYFYEHSEIGIMGPKVLNADYSFQKQCKRGWPTFWNSLTYVLGLYKLKWKNKKWQKLFGGYFLLDKSENEIQEVDQISGSAMIIRKEVFQKIGLLSEDYFLYWEDSDFCFRTKLSGYKIVYYPDFLVLHYGGKGGTQKKPFKNLWYFHRGLFIFYRKYLAKNTFFLVNFIFYLSIILVFLFKFVLNFFKKNKLIGSSKPDVS